MLRGLSAAEELTEKVHDLQAPKEDRALLAHPPLDQAGRLLEENRLRLNALQVDILGQRLPGLRLSTRRQVLDAARKYMTAASEPFSLPGGGALLLAGHQPELFHPGV